ncbi:retrovirus-related pol polyprotein from transposon TNT 1-94 [Tanacetum coccineum]
MRIKQYFLMTYYALWEVIVNEDSPPPKRTVDGVKQTYPPTIIEEKLARKNELKARDSDGSYREKIDADDLEEMDLKWQMAMLTMRARRFQNKNGRKINANGSETIGFNKPKVECYNYHKKGHFTRECRAPRENRNKEPVKRNVTVETIETKALVAQDRLGYDWSDEAEEGPTNFALMAYTSSGSLSSSSSDSEVSTFSKECLKSYETLKEHYDNLTKDFNKSQLNVGTYKEGLESVEARLDVYKKNEIVFEEDIKILKLDIKLRDNVLTELRKKFEKTEKERDDLKLTLEKFGNSSKNLSKLLEIQLSDKFKTGVGFDSQVVDSQVFDSQENDRYKTSERYHTVPPPYTRNFMPHKYDLVLADEEEYVFSESVTSIPNVTTSEAKTSVSKPKSVGEPLIEDWIFDNEDENETEFKSKQRKPSFAKIEFLKSNEQVKTPRESVKKVENKKQAKYPRKNSQSPRGNQRNWNNLMTQKLGSNFEFKNKACYEYGSFNHLIKDCDFYEKKMVEKTVWNNARRVIKDCDFYEKKMVEKTVWNNARRVNHQNSQRMTHPHPKGNFVPKAVLMKSGIKTLNTARQNFSKVAVSVNTARPINTAYPRPIVNSARTALNVFIRAHTHVRRPFNKSTTNKNSNLKEKVNTVKGNVTTAGPKAVVSDNKGNEANVVKASACWVWRPKQKVLDHGNLELELQEKGVIDSGCSRHMTGNKSYLSDYEEIDGGFVAFGGDPKGGRITGKGKISTGKLDFEDVYFVKELKFNLFSVLQMCDKKNSVLFTDTECVVLSPDCKLLDENHVLLRVPRKDNMYCVDLKNIVPLGGIENLIDLKVKVIRCDNGTKFKNKVMNQLCEMKGIKREFSVARTPQQNGGVSYQASQQDPYELFLGRKPALSFMRPFGCLVTILITLDHLGKFYGKADEGFFVGYSTNSKAFMVFNSRTRIVEENLHVKFSEKVPNIVENGPNWFFDIDSHTISMNYKLIIARNQPNGNAGTKENINAGQDGKKIVPCQEYILLPLLTTDLSLFKSSQDSLDAGFKPSGEEEKIDFKHQENEDSEVPNTKEPRVNQEQDANVNSTNNINTVSPTIDADEVGAEADMNNLSTYVPVSPIPTTRVHKDHPLKQIIRDIHLAPQTRRMTKNVTEHVECKKRAIGTKWVYRNKKDDRGIVVRNKARLVAQGYTKEEGIYYDEVFAPVARKEAIRLFLTYASFMRFIVYQMDVKSAFLYGTIKEEVYVCQPPGFKDPQFPDKVYKVYADDIIFGSTKKSLFVKFEQMMHKRFQMSSMRELTFILRLQVKQKDDGIFIIQDKYVANILKKFDFATVKTASTLIETNKALLKDEEAEDVDVHLYRINDWNKMRIFRNLKGQPKLGLWCPRDSPFDLEAFSDSDYVGASLDRKSTIGAEYVAAANCCGQTVIKEWEDRIEKAATTASSLVAEQDSEAQIRFEAASK